MTTRNWVIARQRIGTDVFGAVVVWVPFALFVLATTFLVDVLGGGTITVSGWEIGSQIPRWFAGGMGVFLTAVYLPLYVAHGLTRRECAVQTPVFAALFVIVLAALMTAGYAIERLVYQVAGWSWTVTGEHLFETADQYPLVFTEFALTFAVWVVGGALAGAAFYRDTILGFLLLPVVLAMAIATEIVIGSGFTGVHEALEALFDVQLVPGSLPAALGTAAVSVAVATGLTWALVRDLPIRSRAT